MIKISLAILESEKSYCNYNVNLTKRVGFERVFFGLAGQHLEISLGLCPQENPRSSPASHWKTRSVPPLLLGLTQFDFLALVFIHLMISLYSCHNHAQWSVISFPEQYLTDGRIAPFPFTFLCKIRIATVFLVVLFTFISHIILFLTQTSLISLLSPRWLFKKNLLKFFRKKLVKILSCPIYFLTKGTNQGDMG